MRKKNEDDQKILEKIPSAIKVLDQTLEILRIRD
jgi:hypothetical protein